MPDITPEQHALIKKLNDLANRPSTQMVIRSDEANELYAMLPDDLKKPPVELPTEKWTSWLDKDGDLWVVDSEGKLKSLRYTGANPEYYAPFRAMAPEVDVEKDERVIAWNTIAKHPLFEADYGTEDTLINAMMNHLDRIFYVTPQQPTYATAIADEVKVGDKIGGKRVVTTQRAGSQIIFEFDNGYAWPVSQNRVIENWERGS